MVIPEKIQLFIHRERSPGHPRRAIELAAFKMDIQIKPADTFRADLAAGIPDKGPGESGRHPEHDLELLRDFLSFDDLKADRAHLLPGNDPLPVLRKLHLFLSDKAFVDASVYGKCGRRADLDLRSQIVIKCGAGKKL